MRKLTSKQFDEADHNSVLGTGVVTDPELYENPVRWVAVKGWGNDWAIYYNLEHHSVGQVKGNGDKVTSANLIQNLMPCEVEVLEKYRL